MLIMCWRWPLPAMKSVSGSSIPHYSPHWLSRFKGIFERLQNPAPAPLSCAVRSSATAEDLPDASFAGQQETWLNVVGIGAVLERVKGVFASLYNDRAIAYRVHQGFAHADIALSAGVQ